MEYNRIIALGLGDSLQVDLLDLSNYKSKNKGYRYILLVVDVYSRYAFARKLKAKNARAVPDAFADILEELALPVNSIVSDKGTEFLNAPFQRSVKDRNIKHFTKRPGTHTATD